MLVLSLPYLILYLDLSNECSIPEDRTGRRNGALLVQILCCLLYYLHHMGWPWLSHGSWGHGFRQAWQELMFPPFRKNRDSQFFSRVCFKLYRKLCWGRQWNFSCMQHLKNTYIDTKVITGRCSEKMGNIKARKRQNTVQTGLDGRREWDTNKPLRTQITP